MGERVGESGGEAPTTPLFSQRDPAVHPPPRLRIDAFPVGSPLMNVLMVAVRDAAAADAVLGRKLFQANFHTTLSGEAIVTLVYHRKLDGEWEAAATALKDALLPVAASVGGCAIDLVGRSRGQRLDVSRNHVDETLTVAGRALTYRQVEGAFAQPNGRVCEAMLQWAAEAAAAPGGAPRSDDLLEMYCGNGNFTVALAPAFRAVLATEVSRAGAGVAAHNLSANGASTVTVARADAARVAAALACADAAAAGLAAPTDPETGDPLKPTFSNGVDPSPFALRTLFVDPPRAGVGEVTAGAMARFDRVLYISCNPASLAADAAAAGLAPTHAVTAAAVFDQFPYTDHAECGVLFERREP